MINVRERLQPLDRGVTVYRPEYQGSFLKVVARKVRYERTGRIH